MNKLALAFEKLLIQEEAEWVSLQKFMQKQVDNAVTAEERAQFYQNYMDEFLQTIRALSVYRNSITEFRSKLQTLENEGNVKHRIIQTNLDSYRNSFQHQLIVGIVFFVLGAVVTCGVFGLRIRRERRSRERRQSDRREGGDRRQVEGSAEIER